MSHIYQRTSLQKYYTEIIYYNIYSVYLKSGLKIYVSFLNYEQSKNIDITPST